MVKHYHKKNGWISIYILLFTFPLVSSSPHLSLHLPSLSALPPCPPLPSPSLSKWVSSGVLAGQNHLRANTLLSVVKASPQIPFYTHKCHFPFVCTLAALAQPHQPAASSQTWPAEKTNSVGKCSSCILAPLTPLASQQTYRLSGIKNTIISANLHANLRGQEKIKIVG